MMPYSLGISPGRCLCMLVLCSLGGVHPEDTCSDTQRQRLQKLELGKPPVCQGQVISSPYLLFALCHDPHTGVNCDCLGLGKP
jgi:hypothetical protein